MVSGVRTIGTLELAGNALCLDFANTLNSRVRTVHDYLASYEDLLCWSDHAGSLPSSVTRHLRSQARGSAPTAVLHRAHRLRDTVYAVFSAIAADRRPSPGDLDELGKAYAAGSGNATIESRAVRAYELSWPTGQQAKLDAPLWPVGRSAGELLLNGPLERVGECPGCGWLFLDISRNGARRWCNMATCGSRDKMARYHRLQRD